MLGRIISLDGDNINEELETLHVFVGWDSREDIAYRVCKQSILDHATGPVKIVPLKQKNLRGAGLYTREIDTLSSTEFTFTRFLIPELCNFKGWALFVDCDFVFLDDVRKLFNERDDKYAIMCAHHDYTPTESTKMDGQAQHLYPRKNWSSCMLINCGHVKNKFVTAKVVNQQTGKYLHRFSWITDRYLGEFSHEWNWLVGWYHEGVHGTPKALHYTEGGPWFKEHEDCEYANEYYKVERRCLHQQLFDTQEKLKAPYWEGKEEPIDHLPFSLEARAYLKKSFERLIDPKDRYFDNKELDQMRHPDSKTIRCVSIESDAPYEERGLKYDPICVNFVKGSNGRISSYNREKKSTTPLLIRGLSGKCQEAIKDCIANGRTFYYLDTGYLGNFKHKTYHRITKNGMQNLSEIRKRPHDRLNKIGYHFPEKKKRGDEILICPPSGKVMKFYGEDPDKWMYNTVKEIRKFTDRPINMRDKPTRTERISSDTIWDALDKAYVLITYNSIAATEAMLHGVPAIALAANSASALCNTKISDLNDLYIPQKQDVIEFAAHLSYCQFTPQEMLSGFAWEMLNESS